MCAIASLQSVATNVDVTDVGGEQVIDFDISANTDYEIQSCVMVDENDRVVEAAVRFGRVEERPNIAVGKGILESAWINMVNDVLPSSAAIEADLSDFGHTVPHLRIVRENVEKFDFETVTGCEFAEAVATLAQRVNDVLRADAETMDAEIDEWL